MLPRSYTKLNETVFDIYLERARLPWHFKAFATLSIWLALAGYVVFALVFTSNADNLQSQPTVLTTLAGVGLLLGYVGIIGSGFLCRSLLFIFNDVLIPSLTTSVMGIFIVAMNQGLHKKFDIDTQAYIYVPLVTACVTTLVSAVLSVIVFFKLRRIQDMDERRRIHIPIEQYPYNSSSAALSQPSPALLEYVPDDEAQRRQLLRLLIAREGPNATLEDNGSTYKIDLPFADTGGRPRSGSVPDTRDRGRWNLSNFVPGRSRNDAPSDNFKDPRERRREEIERSTMLLPDPSYSGSHLPGSVTTPPAWAGQPVRYA